MSEQTLEEPTEIIAEAATEPFNVVEPKVESEVEPKVEPKTEPKVEPEESEEEETDSDESVEGDLDPSILNLKKGQRMTGKVKHITDFGIFVDLGISQDGLVHISQMARHKVEKAADLVSQGQEVDVWVKKVDRKRGRISLTMVRPIKLRLRDIKEEAELEGVITRLETYGAFVNIGSERDGLIHISQITHDYIKHPEEVLTIDDKVKIKVLKVDRKKRQVDLSIKALLPPPPPKEIPQPKPKEEVVETRDNNRDYQRNDNREVQRVDVQRNDNRGSQRPDSRGPQRPDSRETQRPDSRETQRPDSRETQRPDSRGPQRSDNRGPQRPDSRETQRPDSRETQRPDNRGPQRSDNRGPQRNDNRNTQRNDRRGDRRDDRKVDNAHEVKEMEQNEGETMLTAMAVAFSAFQNENQANRNFKDLLGKSKGKRRKEIDAIVARTLSAGQK